MQADALLRERAARVRAEESERRTQVIVDVAQALARSVSLDAVLESATEALSGAFSDAGAAVWLHDPERERLRLAASRGYSAEGRRVLAELPAGHESTAAQAFRRRDVVLYEKGDAAMPPLTRHLLAASAPDVAAASVAAAPLLIAGRALGTLSLVVRGQTLDESWLETLRAVGAQVGAAVERTTLYERERTIAERLQGALLPVLENDTLLRMTGLAVAHRYRSGTEGITVGGDFYDLWSLPPGSAPTRLAVVLGDVSGKGLEAAVQTAALRHAVRAYAHLDPQPPRVVARVNDLVAALDLLPQGFATMFFAVVDEASGVVEYCSAGHEALLLRHSGGRIRLLEANAPALGLSAQDDTALGRAELDPGGHLVLYTDGVTEARHPQTRSLLGVDGLAMLLEEVAAELGPGWGAGAFASRLLARVEQYAGGRLEDDAALLVIMRPA